MTGEDPRSIPDPATGSDFDRITTHHVRAAIGGDATALAWLVERFTPMLMAAARRHVGWNDSKRLIEPEELVQETWCIALPRLADVRPQAGRCTPVLLAFLAGILWRRYRTLLRSILRQGQAGDSYGSRFGLLPDSTSGIITRSLKAEATRELHAALELLSEDNRTIVILRAFERVSNNDVAALLGLTPDAVSARYRRALDELRGRLTDPLLDEALT